MEPQNSAKKESFEVHCPIKYYIKFTKNKYKFEANIVEYTKCEIAQGSLFYLFY